MVASVNYAVLYAELMLVFIAKAIVSYVSNAHHYEKNYDALYYAVDKRNGASRH